MTTLCPNSDEVPLNGVALTIPSDYIGISSSAWPSNPSIPTAPDPEPGFNFGFFRVHDSAKGRFLWSRINTANGVYDWTTADAYINYFDGIGKKTWFTLVSTPAWAATSVVNNDPYGQPGGASRPSSAAFTSAFVTALVTRYLGKIKWLEIWNEPRYVVGSFWEDTAAQLVQMGNTVRTAALAVDPTIKIMAPGLNHNTEMDQFLAAQDPTSLNFGYQIIDGLAFHPYESLPSIYDSENSSLDPPRIARVRFANNKVGTPSRLAYVSEFGVNGSLVSAQMLAFLALSAADRKAYLARVLAINAARGVQNFCLYGYGFGNCGDLIKDNDGVVAAVKEFYFACGRTYLANSITQNWRTGVVTMTDCTGRVFQW